MIVKNKSTHPTRVACLDRKTLASYKTVYINIGLILGECVPDIGRAVCSVFIRSPISTIDWEGSGAPTGEDRDEGMLVGLLSITVWNLALSSRKASSWFCHKSVGILISKLWKSACSTKDYGSKERTSVRSQIFTVNPGLSTHPSHSNNRATRNIWSRLCYSLQKGFVRKNWLGLGRSTRRSEWSTIYTFNDMIC